MAKTEGLRELYIDELRDLYDAEHRLIKALPKMAKAADSDELRSGFEHHLQQTKGHAERLEQIFESMGEQAKAKKCKGIEGIVGEGSELLDEDFKGAVKDAAIIASAQRVEHYEIAAYGSVRSFAEQLGETKAASLLQQTLNEEKETDAKLTQMSQTINAQAASADSGAKGRAARA
ncbi:MAG: ferritin-like domain-containing protein [Candidatus Acidiferrales bacterium]